ncbi:MAG: class I SAM-dependent methyltransferase [Chloroflexota bacterium]
MLDHFGILAPIYDKAIPFSRLNRMLRMLELPVDGLLLDVGGGTGRVAHALFPYTGNVYIADYSHHMLLQAMAKGLSSVEVPAEILPFPGESFDRIIMVDALHHVFDQKAAILELWRVLNRGGILIIEEPDVRKWQVKILAIMEKLILMRSHFLTPPQIAGLFPKQAQLVIDVEGYNAWIIVKKI